MSAKDQFMRVVDDIYGLYLDCTIGFDSWLEEINNVQKDTSIKTRIPLEELDKRNLVYGKGNPNLPNSYPLHKKSQGEVKERIKKDGKDYYDIAALCLVLIYQYWDEYYRLKFADEHRVEKNKIKWNIMGDLRLFRQSIIHNRGIAILDINKCKILKWFKAGELININSHQFEEIVNNIKKSVPLQSCW